MRWVQLCSSLSTLWHCLSLGLEWKLTFSSPFGHCWVFQICWHIECSTFTASSSRIWNSTTGIPSPPLALFVVMLSKAHFNILSYLLTKTMGAFLGAWCPLQRSEVVLWNFLSIQMTFQWICGKESGLPVLLLHHFLCFFFTHVIKQPYKQV